MNTLSLLPMGHSQASTELPPNGAAAAYSERVDSSRFQSVFPGEKDDNSKPWPKCAKWALPGECENGHLFAKVLMCGKEWCPDCGEKGSWIHRRRVARLLPKAQQMKTFFYINVEWPIRSRNKLRTSYLTFEQASERLGVYGKTIQKWTSEGKLLVVGVNSMGEQIVRVPTKLLLQQMRIRISKLLKKFGFDRGMDRWHFFGDDDPVGRGYNPHLNVIVETGFLPYRVLEQLKALLRIELSEPELIVNGSYRKTAAEKVHTLKYITRATFLDRSWDERLADDLYGFQNTHSWGRWKSELLWVMDNRPGVVAFEANKCPSCGAAIKWSKPVPIELLWVLKATEIDAGYFSIPPPGEWSVSEYYDLDNLRLWKEGYALYLRNLEELLGEEPGGYYRNYCHRHGLPVELKVIDRFRGVNSRWN